MKKNLIWVVAAAFCTPVAAFELLSPVTVLNYQVDYRVWLPGVQGDGRRYVDVFAAATEVWSDYRFEYEVLETEIIFDNGVNEVVFDDDIQLAGLAYVITTGLNVWNPDTGVTESSWNPETGTWNMSGQKRAAIGEVEIKLGTQNVPDGNNIHGTMVHEIGHTLGLGHSAVEMSEMKWQSEYTGNDGQLLIDDECGIAHLQRRQEDCAAWLGRGASTDESRTWAHFYGFVTNDQGLTAGTTFSPYDEISVYGTITIDPEHKGEPGAVHVFAVAPGGSLYARHEDSSLWTAVADLADLSALPAVERIEELGWSYDLRILGATNGEQRQQPHIVPWDPRWGPEDERRRAAGEGYRRAPLVTGEILGLEGQALEFFLAYSLDSMPGVLFHATQPIVVEWLTAEDLQ